MDNLSKLGLVALSAAALFAAPAVADEKELGWFDTAEFSFVSTDGNADVQTIGFKNDLRRVYENALFSFKAGGVRAEAANGDRVGIDAAGSPNVGDPFVIVDPPTETTAENYYARLRYDRNITERFFWFGLGGWDRNRPAGVENRYVGGAGVGNIWIDREGHRFATDYAVTFTDQENTVGEDQEFGGLRTSWGYLNQLTETTTYTNDLILDFNLDESDDWRGDMINAIQVAISKNLALKASLQLLYDNLPSLESITVFDNAGAVLRAEQVELDELDTIFSASLVVNF